MPTRQAADGIWGTPYYIAPEKVKRQKADARSDIYSLGATLYHALAGQPPFDGETPIEVVKARLGATPPPLHEVRPDIDADVERIVDRMLQAEPGEALPDLRIAYQRSSQSRHDARAEQRVWRGHDGPIQEDGNQEATGVPHSY